MFISHIPTRILTPPVPNNYSLELNGSNQYVQITDASQTGLDFSTAMTLEGWFRFNDISSTKAIFSKRSFTNNNNGYQFHYSGAGNLAVVLSSSGTNSFSYLSTPAFAATTGVWYHFAVTFDGSAQEVKFFVDGSQYGSTITGTISSIFNNNSPFAIGVQSPGGSLTNYFDGLINNVRVWNVVRTESEINTNKNTVLTSGTGLVSAWYSVNNDHNDLTSTGNDLTPVNSPTFSTDVPF